MATAQVLVIEDAPEYAQLISATLIKGGHGVTTATTLADARVRLHSTPPDLVILDLTLPDGDGLDLCQEIRTSSDVYVLMLTGRDDEVDKLVGFRLGADDYMTKPFSPAELAVRVDALLRRARTVNPLEQVTQRQIGNLVIDLDRRRVTIDDVPRDLTKIEFDILDALSERPGSVLTRGQLLNRVWGDNWVGDDHVIDVHIANLRKKVDDGSPSCVRTVRGVGYAMNV